MRRFYSISYRIARFTGWDTREYIVSGDHATDAAVNGDRRLAEDDPERHGAWHLRDVQLLDMATL